MSALLVGFTAVVMSDQRYRFIDRDRGQAFYAATGGLEKLTADLGNLFLTNVAPTPAQLTALTSDVGQAGHSEHHLHGAAGGRHAPDELAHQLRRAEHRRVGGRARLHDAVLRHARPATRRRPSTTPIKTGPYEGLIALQMPYQLDVSARTTTGGEAHLVRTMEAVAIPVFQFGIFSDVDLAFFAGPNFDFGGRVHTNSNLFLSQKAPATR